MRKLNLYIPITKVDEENRLVYGVLAAEELDNSGEIFDYESSKPNFEEWSNAQFEASNGLSKGNVRAMHTSIAAGKLTDISYDDTSKVIEGCAKVVDDGEWQKVLEGVYTGFSMGGRYAKRWNDNGQTRYTAVPVEMSLVDKPCIKSALFAGMAKSFMLRKSDGTTEEREFVTKGDFNEDNVTRNEHGRFSSGGGGSEGHSEEAKAHLEAAAAHREAAKFGPKTTAAANRATDKAYEASHSTSTAFTSSFPQATLDATGDTNHAAEAHTSMAEYHEAQAAALDATSGHGGSDPTGHGGDNVKATTKSDRGDTTMFVPTNDQMLPVAQALAKAADNEAGWLEYMQAAHDQIVAEHEAANGETVEKKDNPFSTHSDDNCKVDNCDKCAEKAAAADDTGAAAKADTPEDTDTGGDGATGEPEAGVAKVTPAGVRQTWTASDGKTFEKKTDCVSHEEELAKMSSLGSMLDAALAVTKSDTGPDDEVNTNTNNATTGEASLGKSIDVQLLELADFITGPDLRKGLYDVSSLCTVLRGAAGAYSSARNEAAREGDGSAVPAALLDATEKLGEALIAMATEEVGEMLTELREAGESDENWVYPECCYLSASAMGLEKADADEFFAKAIGAVEKRGPRLSKATVVDVQPIEDEVTTMAKAAGFDDGAAFIADLAKRAKELDEIRPKVEELTKFVTEMRARPMPAAPRTSIVEKASDVGGVAIASELTPLQKAEQTLAGLKPEEVAQMAIRLAQQNGHTLSLSR